jgi:hypothetical protein
MHSDREDKLIPPQAQAKTAVQVTLVARVKREIEKD